VQSESRRFCVTRWPRVTHRQVLAPKPAIAIILLLVPLASYGQTPIPLASSTFDSSLDGWTRDGEFWELRIDNRTGIRAATVIIDLPSASIPYFDFGGPTASNEIAAAALDGSKLTAAIARTGIGSPVLLRVYGSWDAAPRLLSAEINEIGIVTSPIAQLHKLHLSQNYPNPFNPSTSIGFTLAAGGQAHLAVFDLAGQLVRVLVDSDHPAGSHTAVWDGCDSSGRSVASGSYIYRLTTQNGTVVRKLLLVR